MALAQRLLPALAAALFLYGCGVCGYGILRGAPQAPRTAQIRPHRRALWGAAGTVLAAWALYAAWFLAAALHNSPGAGVAAALQNQFYGNTDARHYIDLAQYGYGTGEAFPEQHLMIVFFPLFPALLRAVSLGGLVPYWLAALLVQPPLACAAGAGLYALVHKHFGAETARTALLVWLLCPGSVFFFAPMTESLFLALSVWYVICLERGRWAPCAVLGLLAGLTRAPGALLSGLAAVWLFTQWRQRRARFTGTAAAAMLAPALGLGLYFLLNFVLYGNWQQYAVYQKEHWNNALGLFTDTVAYHLRYMAAWWQERHASAVYLCLAALLCIFAQLALLAAAARRLPPHWLAYGLVYTAVTTGVTWLISGPRYAAALFCLPAAAALLTQRRAWPRRAMLAALAVCDILYTAQYLAHGPIY